MEVERYINKCKSRGSVNTMSAVMTIAAGEGLKKAARSLCESVPGILRARMDAAYCCLLDPMKYFSFELHASRAEPRRVKLPLFAARDSVAAENSPQLSLSIKLRRNV